MIDKIERLERRYVAVLGEIERHEGALDGLYSELYSIEEEVGRLWDLYAVGRSTEAWREARGIDG